MARIALRSALAVFALFLMTGAGDPPFAHQQEDWRAMLTPPAYDLLMPFDIGGLRAAYRTEPGGRWDEFERYFRIQIAMPPDDGLEAIVVEPVGESIQRQLYRIHSEAPQESVASKVAKISVRRFTVDSNACTAIRNRMSLLGQLPITMTDDRIIRLDYLVHKVKVVTSGGRIEGSFRDGGHALVGWARETLRVFEACAQKGR